MTNYGDEGEGLQNGRGLKFYPYEKGGGTGKVLAMLTEGCTKSFGVVFTR